MRLAKVPFYDSCTRIASDYLFSANAGLLDLQDYHYVVTVFVGSHYPLHNVNGALLMPL